MAKTTINFFGDHELLSTDPARARAFYSELFGWKMDTQEIPNFGSRSEFSPAEGQSGSIMPTLAPEQPSGWAVYVNVPDIAAAVAQVGKLGGKVILKPVEVHGEGIFAVVADPTGGVFKLWESLK
jgi:predicted enzyme related to lactoylglutathione lyase